MTCVCDGGWAGSRCETKTCALKCKHGGSPNRQCNKCTGCLGAWGGKLCGTYDASVPQSTLMRKLDQIASASQSALDSQKHFNPVCKQGHECVGWGVNGVTGRPTSFPVVHLSYDPTRTDKKFNGMSEPVEVNANHVVNPVWAGIDGTNVFPRIEDYEQHVASQYLGASPVPAGTAGIYSLGFERVFDTYFQRDDDSALTVVRASKSLISMQLPFDPTTNTRTFQFDRNARAFALSLPPRYDTEGHKAQFRKFIESYGTSYATSATLGGLVEQYSSWNTWITNARSYGITSEELQRSAQIDFGRTTGLETYPSGDAQYAPGYVSHRHLNPIYCEGGDSKESCAANFEAWARTIGESPVLLDYHTAPISDLVDDPDVKAALDRAVQEYVAENNAAWSKIDKCPRNCHGASGRGVCKRGQSSCSCTYDGIIGRMCSQCAPVMVRGMFRSTDNLGGKLFQASGQVMVGCGATEQAWKGSSSCLTEEDGKGSQHACMAAAKVDCTRLPDGNLIASLSQEQCVVTPFPGPNDGRCGPFTGHSRKPSGSKISTSSASVETDAGKTRATGKKHKITVTCEFV